MIVALILFLVGIFLIVSNPILGFIPGIILVVVSVIVFVLAMLGRGIGAIASIGSTKKCPGCRTEIPSDASVCRQCGYRYG
jgi:hypothetical protein